MIPINLVTYSFLSLFWPFVETTTKNQTFTKLVVWIQKIFFFVVISSRTLLLRYTNSIDFYKIIFFHAISARIIVQCIIKIKYQNKIASCFIIQHQMIIDSKMWDTSGSSHIVNYSNIKGSYGNNKDLLKTVQLDLKS